MYWPRFNKGNVELISEKNNISHVGWNNIKIQKNSKLFENIKNNTDFILFILIISM